MNREIKIISIDDEDINLDLIREYGKNLNLDIPGFTRPLEALEYITQNNVDIVLVDYMMPDMDGIELIREIRKITDDVFTIMITGVKDDDELETKALEAGATEFLTKPLKGSQFAARLKNLVELRISQILLKDKARLLKREVDEATMEINIRELETLEVLGMAAEYKDPETATHIHRVAHYSRLLAKKHGESAESTHIIYYSAPLHDIGKMSIPDMIMLKEGPLSDSEWETMKRHTINGYRMIQHAKSKFLQAGAIIALTHHECYDGTGYPNSLKGDEIHIYGRIVALADTFDALNTRRPYKEPWEFQKSMEFIISQKGKKFDPALVDVFSNNIDEFMGIYNKIKDE